MKEGEIPTIYRVWIGGGILAFEKNDFSHRTIATHVQQSSSTVMRVWKQWMMEGDVSTRRSTPAPHGGEWLYSFLLAIGSTLVYCYRCTNISFANSSTSAAQWTVCKDTIIQDSSHHKPLMAALALGSWAQSLASWLAPSCLFSWIALQFVGPWWLCSY